MEALSAFSLPPGFGFRPTDVELISHYLKRKILGMKIDFKVIREVEIYKHEPWDIPAKCHVPTRDGRWHFFASRNKKYSNGSRSKRATEAGYWKSTSKELNIKYQNRIIGTKKTLVFHEGRPPCRKGTDWIMHEYYINESECQAAPDLKDSYILCRITKRNGWAVDGENVTTQNENVDESSNQPNGVDGEIVSTQTKNVDENSNQPNDVAPLFIAPEKSSQFERVEIEAMFTELFGPNFSAIPTLTEVQSEPRCKEKEY